jgi:hypothetical protein
VGADQALVTDALKLHADGKPVVVIYFFEESFARIESTAQWTESQSLEG